MEPSQTLSFDTRCIHGGLEADPLTGAIMTPIYQTSTYVQDGPGNHKGYEYSRTSNPTRTALEKNIATLESAKYALCFASGCAAATNIFMSLNTGDHILSVDDLYGGTYRLMTKVFSRMGISSSFVDFTDPSLVAKSIQQNTKLIWIETPTNPLLRLVDIEAICALAKKRGITVAVDNTLATPYLQNPLSMGADLVVHSTTKYMGGHSDVVGGAIATNSQEWRENLHFIQNSTGGVPAPLDVFLVLRGIKTLHVRMERHIQNAMEIASFLESHPAVETVFYPGLNSHPQFELCKRQMRGAGGMISFCIKGDLNAAISVVKSTRIFACAESLGGIESLIELPAAMTHASIPAKQRENIGISDGLIRLSVGIENVSDLKQDLEQALSNKREYR